MGIMDNKKFILKTFNTHLKEFMDDVLNIFPNEVELLTSRTFMQGVIKVKPKIIIEYWYINIYLLYKVQIDKGDFDFFLNKDYNMDVVDNNVLKGIDNMRIKINSASETSKIKSVEYAKNLSKLSVL